MNKLQRLAAMLAAFALMLQVITLPVSAVESDTDDIEVTSIEEIEEEMEEEEEEMDEDEFEDEDEDEFDGVDSDDAVEELEDAFEEDETREEAEEDIEELVEEILEDVEDDEDAQEVLEEVEEDTEEIIEELEEELEDTTDPTEREEILRRIHKHRMFLHKLRVRILQNHHDLAKVLRRASADHQLYSIRWGVLNESRHRNCDLDREAIREAIEAKEIPDCGVTKIDYTGEISVNTGDLKVVKKVLFELNDTLGIEEGSSIDWTSRIAGHWDGLIVEFKPDADSSEEVEVTISIGDLDETFVGNEIFGKHEIGNEHRLDIKPLLRALEGVSDANRDRLIRNKDRVQDKLENLRKKIREIRLMNQNDSDGVDDSIDDLEEVLEEIEEYSFDDESTNEIEDEINDLLDDVSEGVSKEKLTNRIKVLKARLAEIKKLAKTRKFSAKLIPFKDTDDDQWYTSYVAPMKERGIVSGFKDANGRDIGEYRPSNNVTVAEVLKIALKSANEEEGEGNPKLKGAINHWAKAYVKRAEELGLDIVGDLDEDLNRAATRAEVVRIMLEAAGVDVESISSTDFSDLSASHKHAAFVQLAKELGIVSGDDGTGNFRPDEPINRAEVAKIANQILEVLLGEL